MKRVAFLLIVGILTTSLSGCAKIRQLTRRDYKSLQDPFMLDESSNSSIASTAAASASGKTVDSGFVQIPDTQSSPSSTRTVSATQPQNGTFRGVQANGMGGVINRNQQPSATTGIPSGQPKSFVRDMRNLQVGQAARQTTAEAESDFADWAAQQKKQFEMEVQQVAEKAQPVINDVKQLGQLANQATAEPLIQPVSSQQAAEPLILQPPGFSTAGLQKSVEDIRRDVNQVQSNAAAAFAEIESAAQSSEGFSPLAGASGETSLPEFNPSEFELEIPNQSPVQRPQPAQRSPFANVSAGQNSTATQFIPSTPATRTATQRNPFSNANLAQPKLSDFEFPRAQAPRPAVTNPSTAKQGSESSNSPFSFDSGWQSSDIQK